jgi:hypothetical protein
MNYYFRLKVSEVLLSAAIRTSLSRTSVWEFQLPLCYPLCLRVGIPQLMSALQCVSDWVCGHLSCTHSLSTYFYLLKNHSRGVTQDPPNANVILVPVGWLWGLVTYIAFRGNRTQPIVDKEAQFSFSLLMLKTTICCSVYGKINCDLCTYKSY